MSVVRVGVRGMSCSSCAAALERALSQLPSVSRAEVNYAAELATIESAGDDVQSAVEQRIRDLGYTTAEPRGASDDDTALSIRLAITAFFTVSAMTPSSVVLFGTSGTESPTTARILAVASAVLALPALIVGGGPLLVRAIRSVRARAPGMDLLVAAGALVTFVHSLVVLVRGGHEVYFDTAAMIVLFALLGRVLERRARRRGVGAVRALDALVPNRAHLVDRGTAHVRDVAVESLEVSDLVRVRAGERVPVDGSVREGASLVETAILTGEWAPRAISTGDRVTAGFLLHDGTLLVEVERAAGRREVDLIRRAVDDLMSSRAPMQRMADTLAARLAWVVLTLALLTLIVVGVRTGFGPEAWLRAVAVVVIACPCALGLATPMVITVAAARAASRGVLFRDAEALEAAASVDRVFLDKTGTITEGRPRIVSVTTVSGIDRDEILGIASALEAGVEHPIARALREAAAPRALPLAITVVPGHGVIGRGASTWIIGSARFLRTRGIDVAVADGSTAVHVARDGALVATIVFEDAMRAHSARAVASLARPALVTGDARSAAAGIAAEVGIAELYAEVTPLEKASIVEAARARGERVAFVGDGLNDGPALAAANVGIAVHGATELAAECARVVLVGGGVEQVHTALAIARAARRVMRQNLAWAIGYNLVAIPAAASGRLSPAIAAAAMAASSLSVVLNSLRDYRGVE